MDFLIFQVLNTEPLRIGLEDIKNIPIKGKWWLVGSTWAGRDSSSDTIPIKVDATNNLLLLAKAQKMNTDVRRSIFVVLMSSQDYMDAYERLLKLGLKDKQEREIARVLIHCCVQEKAFNPFYSLIGQKFCEYAYSFQVTFQYVLWDIFKASGHDSTEYSDKEGIRRMAHTARFYLNLIQSNALSITVLKSLNFTSLSRIQILFCQIVVGNLVLLQGSSKSEKQVGDIFSKSKAASADFREGLVFFVQQYITVSCQDIVGVPIEKTFLKTRIKWIKNLLVK
jgi:nucleolar MIF4G domain-containing protein 1